MKGWTDCSCGARMSVDEDGYCNAGCSKVPWMKHEIEIDGRKIPVVCPWCTDPDHPPPDPVLIETDRFWCQGRTHPSDRPREFVCLTPADYADEIAASRPALVVGDLLRRL